MTHVGRNMQLKEYIKLSFVDDFSLRIYSSTYFRQNVINNQSNVNLILLVFTLLFQTQFLNFYYKSLSIAVRLIQGGSNMTGTNCDLFTHNQSRSYLNHLLRGPEGKNHRSNLCFPLEQINQISVA
jgi:hypothetical protein